MIQNLRPRVLNKSASPSVIKSVEMLDAVNIVADGLYESESNTIKKAQGNIKAYINDTTNVSAILGNNPSGDSVTVIGSLVDEENQRVFYFAVSESESVGYIYLLQQFSEDEISLTLLLKSTKLDFKKESFVASDILKIPIQEKELSFDQDVSGTQDDGSDLISFDDSVEISDIIGEVQVFQAPSGGSITVLPGSDSVYETSITLQNVGGATASNNTVYVGEGNGPQDPVDQQRISISVVGGDNDESQVTSPFQIAAGATKTVQVRVALDSAISSGVYSFYVEAKDASNNAIASPSLFALNVTALEFANPRFRVQTSVFGPGTVSSINGNVYTAGIGVSGDIEQNSIVDAGVAVIVSQVQLSDLDAPEGFIYPETNVSMSLGQNQSFFEMDVLDDDNVGTSLELGSVNATFGEVIDSDIDEGVLMKFVLKLKTDIARQDELSSFSLMFSEASDIVGGQGEDVEQGGTTIPFEITHSVQEEVIIAPANISIIGGNKTHEFVKNGNVDQNVELNGSESTFVFNIKNDGDVAGYYILDLEVPGTSTPFGFEKVLSAYKSLVYSVNSETVLNTSDRSFYASQSFTGPLAQEIGGPDAADVIIEIPAQETQSIQIKCSNVGEDFRTQLITDADQDFESALIGQYSWLGYPGHESNPIVKLKTFDTDPITLGSSINTMSPSSTVDLDINVSLDNAAGPLIIDIRRTGTKLVTGSTLTFGSQGIPNLFNNFVSGEGESSTSYNTFFMPSSPDAGMYSTPYVDTIDALEGSDLSVGVESGDMIFDVFNRSIGGGDTNFTMQVTPLETAPDGAIPFQSQASTAGEQWHGPGFLGAVAVGSLGYVIQYTDPKPNDDFSAEIVASEFVNTDPSSAWIHDDAEGTDHPYFGKYRSVFTTLPPDTYIRVCIKPMFSNEVLNTFSFLGSTSLGGAPNSYSGLASKIICSINGNTTTPTVSPKKAVIRHAFTQEQWNYLDSSSQGLPALRQAPPPSLPQESVSARTVINPSEEVGSLTVTPAKKSTKTKSSGLKKVKKKRYGK